MRRPSHLPDSVAFGGDVVDKVALLMGFPEVVQSERKVALCCGKVGVPQNITQGKDVHSTPQHPQSGRVPQMVGRDRYP